jgi:signal peptidase II
VKVEDIKAIENAKVAEEKALAQKRYLPFLLTLGIVLLDQFTKYLVVKNIPVGTIAKEYFGDFLWICHVRNTGAAFSLGAEGSVFMRIVVLILVPIALMVLVGYLVATSKDYLTKAQRWFAAGVLGGGLGTIIDRIFRFDTGVVDFISVKFYGILGMERWPTFNVSDSCVVIFVILLAISMIFGKHREDETIRG